MGSVTVFTSNSPRHNYLVQRLQSTFDKVYVVAECSSIFPGANKGFFEKSEVMNRYFEYVLRAEKKVFGSHTFNNFSRYLPIGIGDLKLLGDQISFDSIESDYYVVFGSSFIQAELCQFLIKNSAINLHMGLSPYYKGSSCNFWAAYDGNYDKIGGTIHLLSEELDSGPILCQEFGYDVSKFDYFEGSMQVVKNTIDKLIDELSSGQIFCRKPVAQDDKLLIRYSKNQEFTDSVANEFLERHMRLS